VYVDHAARKVWTFSEGDVETGPSKIVFTIGARLGCSRLSLHS
jgi:hypothetical protein